MKKVCVLGLGYIGLPTASILAINGFFVFGIDLNEDIIYKTAKGISHIHEPELDTLVRMAVTSGKLQAFQVPRSANIFIIAVPTPCKEDYVPDLSYVKSAIKSITPFLQAGNLIIIESTCPVGTTEKIIKWIQELRPELNFNGDRNENSQAVLLAYCPERVLPGRIFKELVENDRIIGGINNISAQCAADFYRQFINGRIFLTNSRTAEMVKLVENSFRDVNIAFANELSMLCGEMDIDVWEVINLANRHPRVQILSPGPGVGGHCIAIDPWFIVHSAPDTAKLIKTARQVNNYKPKYVLEQIRQKGSRFKMPVIACFGLAYKGNIGDLRKSPAVTVVKELVLEKDSEVLVVEPFINQLPPELAGFANLHLVTSEEALNRADIAVLLVKHDTFLTITHESLREKVVIDTLGVW